MLRLRQPLTVEVAVIGAGPVIIALVAALTLASTSGALAEQGKASGLPLPGNCPVDEAVYQAVNASEKHKPDELRFSFEPNTALEFPSQHWDPDEIETVILDSAEMAIELKFNLMFQNNTGIRTAWTEVPIEKFSIPMNSYYEKSGHEKKALSLESVLWVVTEDFEAYHVPMKRDKAPVLVMFPDFRPWMHSSNNGLVSAGIQWGVFRFARCR